MTVFVMKLLAVCSMLIDHTAVFLYPHFIGKPVYEWMRAFGRLGFPIFAFLIVNGYQKTHDVKRYLTRLIAFAAISQIPYVLALQANRYPDGVTAVALGHRWFVCAIFIFVVCAAWFGAVRMDASVIWPLLALPLAVLRVQYAGVRILGAKMNVFYTLSLSLAVIAFLDAAMKPERDWVKLLMQALGLFGAFFLIRDNVDYGSMGVALILSLWLARGSRYSQAAVIVLWSVVEYIVPGHPITHFIFACLSIVPVLLYKGRQGPPLKLAFYAVYPVHLAVLGALTVYFTLT